jgi:tetratricopeptide (TPR) repeat protein
VGAFVLDARWGIAQGFDTYFDRFDAPSLSATGLGGHERPADQVLRPAIEWMAERGDRAFFAFLHFFDPHAPYDPPSAFLEGTGGDVARYDAEIAFVDSQVGKLVAFLKERGIYEKSLIVLLGDHGESLGEHGEATHGLFVYDATIRVPLLVRVPGIASGTRIGAQVRTIDVMPTVLALLGFENVSVIDGRSLAPLLDGRARDLDLTAYFESHYSRLHFGWAPLRGLRTDRFKFIEAPARELYDLKSDRAETTNRAKTEARAADALRAELSRLRAEGESPRLEAAGRDPETERILRSLGYITSFPSAAAGAEENLADPKDKIEIFGKVTEAIHRNQAGDVQAASVLLRDVLEEDPEVVLAYLMLGNIHLQRKDYPGAESLFRRALAQDEGNVEAAYGLARAYQGSGRLPEADAGYRKVLELDPDQVRAAFQLAEVNLALGRAAEAESILSGRLTRTSDSSLRLVLADALLRQGKRDAAWAVLREAERDDRENPMVHLNIGNLLLEDNRPGEALDAYRRARELDPKSAEIANALGNALARSGEDGPALEAFQEAAELDPGYAPARNNLGIALARSGRFAEAERAFARAIEIDPDYAEAHNNLGFLYLQRGAVSRSIPLLRRAVALKPDYAQARLNLEEALRREKK